MKVKKCIFVLLLLGICFYSQAQVKTNFNNDAVIASQGRFAKAYKTQIDFQLPAKDVNQLLQIERKEVDSNKTRPFKIAVPVQIDLDIAKAIIWSFDNEYAFGKFTIKLNGALSSSINFDQFYLPPGTELYVYNESGNMITGPVTENENNVNKTWGSWVYKGELLIIEIKTPAATVKDLLLHSSNIAYGYKELYKNKVGGFGQSGSCNINVLCSLGSGWEPERNSIALGISGDGTSTFSGSMLMNTCGTSRPLFLTANHVYNAAPPVQNVTNWRFTFQAWSAVCTPSQNADGITYNGSTLRATWSNSDFCLVELNSTPPTNSNIYYAGWTRSTTPALNETAIHHPKGDVMKISRAANPAAISSIGGYPSNHHWQVTWTQGVTEPGSSGSPLFDHNHRVLGQLTGGPSICGGSALRDYYGRFDLSWAGGGTAATRLSDWLDPVNSGATTTSTTSISALIPTPTSITGPAVFCTPQAYTANVPAGTNVTWSVTPAGIVSLSQSGNTATLTKITNGVIALSASLCGSTPVVKNITVGTPQPQYITVNNGPCPEYTVSTNSIPCTGPCSSYTWSFYNQTTGAPTQTFPNSANVRRLILNQGSGTYNFSVKITNACGTSATQSTTRAITCNFGMLTVSPNPASESILVETSENNKFTRLRIIDKIGQVRKEITTAPSQKLSVNISNLTTDIYRIQAFFDGRWETVSFIKQ